MQRIREGFIYSASDLNNFLECRRLTELETLVAFDRLVRPVVEDEQAELIRRKGDQHERAYLERLQGEHANEVVRFDRADSGPEAYRAAEALTLQAMRAGAKVIYQATFFDGRFLGHADFLRRIETPSTLGAWSYEVIDTKLALSSRPYFVVQLCNYSEHLQRLQGRMPEHGYIVLGNGEEQQFRLHDYLAYYHHLKARFLELVADPARAAALEAAEYPHKCGHCGICAWNDACKEKREADDHLSLVAGMRRDQIRKFESAGISGVAVLSQASDERRPERMDPESFEKLRKQASLQVRGRSEGPIYELLPHDARTGFGLLPTPAEGDVYFDMEGDPLFEPGRGLEYLFGCWMPGDSPEFKAFWGLDRAAEKTAFESFIDFIVERRRRYPALHVYHYANYEKAALRRLSQEHSTRADEVDELLRGEVLVDLYAVVRQSVMISEDSYSIKRFEQFYGMNRATDVKKGDESIVMFESWLQHRDRAVLDDIEAYNRDDCRSTLLLHRWLLERRAESIAKFGSDIPFRPVKEPNAPCHDAFFEDCTSCKRRRSADRDEAARSGLERRLLRGILAPGDEREYRRMGEQARTRYVMGHLLSYHRREEKSGWWAYYDRCENVDALREFDRDAIGDLTLLTDVEPVRLKADRSVYTYRFPEQRHKLEHGAVDDPHERRSAGTIVAVDDDCHVLTLRRKTDDDAAMAVTALIPGGPIDTGEQMRSLTRIAQHFADGDLERVHPATYDLLTARDPRTTLGRTMLQPQHVDAPAVFSVVGALDDSYLFIQGPPGSGKSTIGSQVIADLLAAKKRVAILSTGHKAIHNLLHMLEARAAERGQSFRGMHKHSSSNSSSRFESTLDEPLVVSVGTNDPFEGDDYDLASGTSWLFAREALTDRFDYLFIDEAGQVSLADAIAVSACAKNVVLMGDPAQLAQVSQGAHALHVDDSVLLHLLGEDTTVSPQRGIFLDVSYRMHPDICAFISDAVYGGRLRAGEKTATHRVSSPGLSGSGLRYAPVEHGGNSSSSAEEAAFIVREIGLLQSGTMVDSNNGGVERGITDDDIIVVAPYNAQRRLIERELEKAGYTVRVGTVDKFQGQQAAVVFFSMATSSAEDVPRDIGFLFELNRINVAMSRARAMSVLVCSPRLLEIPCRTAEQMAMVNVLCAYVAAAETSALASHLAD